MNHISAMQLSSANAFHPTSQEKVGAIKPNDLYARQLDQKSAKKDSTTIEIQKLLDHINDKKTAVEIDTTVDNVMAYKDAVKGFLNYYVDNVMHYDSTTNRHPKYGYQQKMTVINEATDKADALHDVMNLIDTKSGHLDMLNRIGEISGMILNIVL